MSTPRRTTGRMPIAAAAAFAAFVAGGLVVQNRAVAVHAGAAQASPTAIAFVDLAKLLDGLEEREVLEKQLQTKIEQRQAELEELRTQFNEAQELLKIESPGTEAHRQKVVKLYELEATFKVRQEALQTIIAIEKGTTLVGLYTKIRAAAESIAQREGWDAVLIDDADMPLPDKPTEREALQTILGRRVLFSADRTDITDLLRTEMNNKYQAGAGKP